MAPTTMTIDLARTTVNELVRSIDAEWRALRTRNEVLSHRNTRLAEELGLEQQATIDREEAGFRAGFRAGKEVVYIEDEERALAAWRSRKVGTETCTPWGG